MEQFTPKTPDQNLEKEKLTKEKTIELVDNLCANLILKVKADIGSFIINKIDKYQELLDSIEEAKADAINEPPKEGWTEEKLRKSINEYVQGAEEFIAELEEKRNRANSVWDRFNR